MDESQGLPEAGVERNVEGAVQEETVDWDVVDALFGEALELPANERRAFVFAGTEADSELRSRVLGLLEAADEEDHLLDLTRAGSLRELWARIGPDGAERRTEVEDPLIGTVLGSYRVLRRLGRGGMGTVYLGEREGGFDHIVAIKTLRRGIDTDEVVERFLAERQILAHLEHPNVARLLDGGTTPDGRPYFVMEYVAGQPITAFADEKALGVEERLDLFRTVADAVQHAHRHLVVHRDLKPSNILVTDDGQVKLLDFGIARLIGAEHRWGQTRTSTGFRVLTPAYASPEQVERTPTTTATDVYQLGALLYELLAGVRPFPADLSEAELEERIRKVEPQRLSEAVRSRGGIRGAARRGRLDPVRLAKRLQGDLDVVVAKALRKQPDRRYASVERMSADVLRHLQGRPIGARKPTIPYRLKAFLGRNPWFIPSVGVTALFGAIYLGTLLRHNGELTRERNAARIEADRANAVTTFLEGILGAPDPFAEDSRRLGVDVTVLEALDAAVSRVEVELEGRPEVQARLLQTIGDAYAGLDNSEQAEGALERALALNEEVFGPGSAEALSAKLALVPVVQIESGPEEAIRRLGGDLERARALGDEAGSLVGRILAAMAWAEWGRPDLDSALVLYERSIESFESLPVPDPHEHGIALRRYGRVLGIKGQYRDQLAPARKAVAMLESVLPDDHLELASARQDVGSALLNNDDYEAAVDFFRLAQKAYETQVAPDNSNLLGVRNNAALALHNMGDLEAAEAEYAEIGSLWLGRYGRNRGYGDNLQNRAVLVRDLGLPKESLALSREAHEVYSEFLGDHYLTALPLLSIAGVELDQERPSEALEASTEAHRILIQTLGAEHWVTSVALCRRGRSRWMLGDRSRGLEDLTAAQRILVDAEGATADYRSECLSAHADAQGLG
ncbi:MAG: protein kinase domain-containing protein [Longimicrobiales bacterium]